MKFLLTIDRLLKTLVAFPMLGVAYWLYLAMLTPDNNWIEIRRVFVDNSTVTEPALIHLDWSINKDFIAKWYAVLKRSGNGDTVSGPSFVTVCYAFGENRMWPERRLPQRIDTNWWMKNQCGSLLPGHYYIETIFTWDAYGFERSITSQTNVFDLE